MSEKNVSGKRELTKTESFVLSRLQNPQRIHLSENDDIFETVSGVISSGGFEDYLTSKGWKENKIEYYNIPCAFDIETSSFYMDGEKQGAMYLWQLGICGYNFTGRTWEALLEALRVIKEVLDISLKKRLVIYDHNLSYEFQWMRLYFKWSQVFAVDSRKVAYCVTEDGFEFRCSYILTGKSLEMVGNDLTVLPCDKLHTLDYSQIRLSTTDIEPQEMDYAINDIRVVQHLIMEKIMQDGSITKIPLTNTGYCRRFLKSKCLYGENRSHKGETGKHYIRYTRLMKALQIDGYREYKLCKEAFMGGFTHSNPKRTRKVIRDGQAGSLDYTSDYPYHMVAYPRYPMSSGQFVRPRTEEEFLHNLKYYACIFEIELHDVKATFYNDFYIPLAKCRCVRGAQVSNGRIVSADQLVMTMTELDWEIISKTYSDSKEKRKLGYFVRYRRGYLPTPIVESVLRLYKDKTELKGVEGAEEYYQLRKGLLNAAYGVIVTDLLRPEQVYKDDEWKDPQIPEIEEAIEKYNKKKDRFLFYPWGIFVTSLSRRSLWEGIMEFGDDYIYSDTDSIKAINIEKHERYIKNYNRHCHVLLEEAMKYHGLDLELCHPKTKKGVEKWLGEWDFEGYYDMNGFKTLGCKRYMTLKDGKLSITVSGLNKKVAVPYMLQRFGSIEKCFEAFDDELTIPAGYTGKLTHTYIDDECCGDIIDYKGNLGHYDERSFIHLEDQEYNLGITQTFKDFITSLDREYV